MELYQLKYFLHAAKYENISMAAQELHVSQPSVSKAIKALEKELHVELMKKNGKYCSLTHEGYILQERLIPILEEINEFPQTLSTAQTRQTIRLNVLSANLLVPELIRGFWEENPDVVFKVLEQRESINWDICIRSTLPAVFFNSAVKLMDEKLFLAVNTESELWNRIGRKRKTPVTIDEIRDEDFIILKEGGSIRTIMDRRFREAEFLPRVALECENFYMLQRMVEEGLGVAIWPQFSWRSHLHENPHLGNSNIRLVPLDIPGLYRSLYLVYPKNVKINRVVEQFTNHAVKYFGWVRQVDNSF